MNRRFWLQFSTRFLLWAIAITALPFAWVRRRYTDAVIQSDAVKQLRSLQSTGGTIMYYHEWDHQRDCFSNNPIPGNVVLRHLLGDHFYLKPYLVMFWNFEGEASLLRPIAKLTTVESVAIVDSPKIDDEIFESLTQLPELRSLSLAGTSVTAKGVARLAALPHLNGLLIANTNVAKSDLAYLRDRMPLCEIDHDKEVEARINHWIATGNAEPTQNKAIDAEPPTSRFEVDGRARRPGHR